MARMARICTTSMGLCPDSAASMERALALLDTAGRAGCDLALLPEDFAHLGLTPHFDRDAGVRAQEQVAEKARAYSMYVMAGLYHMEAGSLFNGAFLFDRGGRVAGVYDKLHPTDGEIEQYHVVPGDSLQVFDLDFARVGALICFDINWQEEWRRLKEQGAELVCWLSAYDGGFPLQAYAYMHRYYVASSVLDRHGKMIDIAGDVVTKTGAYSWYALADVNFDLEVFEVKSDWTKLHLVQQKYGDAIRIKGYSEEGMYTVESVAGDVAASQVARECGLEPLAAYIERCTRVQTEARRAHDQGLREA